MQQAINSNIGLACVEAGDGGSGQAGNKAGRGHGGGCRDVQGLPGRRPPHYPRSATVAPPSLTGDARRPPTPGGAARGFASPRQHFRLRLGCGAR